MPRPARLRAATPSLLRQADPGAWSLPFRLSPTQSTTWTEEGEWRRERGPVAIGMRGPDVAWWPSLSAQLFENPSLVVAWWLLGNPPTPPPRLVQPLGSPPPPVPGLLPASASAHSQLGTCWTWPPRPPVPGRRGPWTDPTAPWPWRGALSLQDWGAGPQA